MPSLKLTNIAPENGWCEQYFSFGDGLFSGAFAVSFREGVTKKTGNSGWVHICTWKVHRWRSKNRSFHHSVVGRKCPNFIMKLGGFLSSLHHQYQSISHNVKVMIRNYHPPSWEVALSWSELTHMMVDVMFLSW